jgi:hypothetical protein
VSLVGAFDLVSGVRQLRSKLSVVRQEQQPFGVVIETPDRIDILADTDEIDHRPTPLRVGTCRDDAGRLVQQDVAMTLRLAEPPAVDLDVVGRRIGLDAHFPDRVAVHRDAPFLDQLLSGAARCDSSLRQDFLEADTFGTVHASMFSLLGSCSRAVPVPRSENPDG